MKRINYYYAHVSEKAKAWISFAVLIAVFILMGVVW
jgi:hypothetical protein